MKRRITVTTGTRSEYGILRPILRSIAISKKLELCSIVAGMHLSKKHGLTINEIKKDGFHISKKISMVPKGNSTHHMAQALGEGVIKFSKAFLHLKPDINLILGDRDEAFSSALAASHMNIPNAHIHGGDKSQAGIDEYNRHAITKLSNIHFASTRKSMQRIIKMGENPKYVFNVGSPSIDEIVQNKITTKSEIEKKYKLKFSGSEILLIQHPVTTQSEESDNQISNTLKAIVKLGKNTIAIGPNSDAGNMEIFKNLIMFSKKYNFIKFYRTLPRNDYLSLLKNCSVIVGNSSSAIIESSYFNTPAVNIGIRQKNRERGKNVIDVKGNSTKLIEIAIRNALRKNKTKFPNHLYGTGKSSKKIVKILENISLNKELIQKQIFY